MPLSKEKEDYLSALYFNLDKPGAFRSPLQLWRQVKKEDKYKIGLSRIRQWLQNQDVYSMNSDLVFKRARVMTGGIRDQYDICLMDVGFHSAENDGVRYILIVIDVFTRYLWASPLNNKSSSAVLAALKKCFKDMGTPRKVRSDLGKALSSLKTEEYFKSIGVKHFTPQGEAKSNYVERVIRTLRSLIHRSSKKARSFRYIDKLESLVRNYNITPHKSLGYKHPRKSTKGTKSIRLSTST